MKNTKKLSMLLIVAAMTASLSASEPRDVNQVETRKSIQGSVENGVMEQQRKKGIYSQNRIKKDNKQKIRRLNKQKRNQTQQMKLRYISKLNEIEQCVLLVNTKEDFDLCNRRVHNLSRSLNKMERRGMETRPMKFRR